MFSLKHNWKQRSISARRKGKEHGGPITGERPLAALPPSAPFVVLLGDSDFEEVKVQNSSMVGPEPRGKNKKPKWRVVCSLLQKVVL